MTKPRQFAACALAALAVTVAVPPWCLGEAVSSPTSAALHLDCKPEAVANAMRATVLIERERATRSFGAGVILTIRNGVARIATARHVVDPPPEASAQQISITTIDGAHAPATVEWVAPHGIDLAVVSAPVSGSEVREAEWNVAEASKPGDEVFAIGHPDKNPWVHSKGTITQLREQKRDGYEFHVLQSEIALGPGDSGGGVFSSEGHLVGITSLAGGRALDPRFPAGVSLSTSLATILDLAPVPFGLSARNVHTPDVDH